MQPQVVLWENDSATDHRNGNYSQRSRLFRSSFTQASVCFVAV
jgi:hypothetical protein